VKDLDAKTLNARLVGGHRLLVTRGLDDRVVACAVEFFGERVPVALFNAYVADGMIAVPKDGRGFSLSTVEKKRLTPARWGRRP
jgi:hypothetical protein